jgi:cyanate lyase
LLPLLGALFSGGTLPKAHPLFKGVGGIKSRLFRHPLSELINQYLKFMTVEFPALTGTLLAAKKAKGLSFNDLERILGRDEVWIASLFYGQNSTSVEEAQKLADILGLGHDVVLAMTAYPSKGLGPVVPTDPLIYRFYEIIQVYGYPIKEIIHEKFGDGIMSAIDFTLDIDKVEDPKGDRVRITMNGKFLEYKKW